MNVFNDGFAPSHRSPQGTFVRRLIADEKQARAPPKPDDAQCGSGDRFVTTAEPSASAVLNSRCGQRCVDAGCKHGV
jgi:hypothetical protein